MMVVVHLVHIRMMWLKVVVGRHCQVLGVWRGIRKVRDERRPTLLLRLLWWWLRLKVRFLSRIRSVLRHSSMMRGLSRDERRLWKVVERSWWVGVITVRM